MRNILYPLMALLLLSACGKEHTPENISQSTAKNALESTPENVLESTPEKILHSGLALAGMDTHIRPQDDFFAFANGTWIKNTQIPSDKSSWGSFNILHEKTLKQLQVLVEDAANNDTSNNTSDSAQQTIGNYYTAFLDTDSIAKLGLKPLADELARIDNITNHSELAAYFGHSNIIGVDSPLNFWIDQDAKDSVHYILYFTQSGLGLPDRDYYFDKSERGQKILKKYHDFINQLMQRANPASNGDLATHIIHIETALAEAQWNRVDNRDSDKTYNKLDQAALKQLLPDYPLKAFLKQASITEQSHIIVRQPSYVQALNQIFKETKVSEWQHYARFKLLSSYAPYLDASYEQLHFDFYQRTLSGQPEQAQRWKRAINSMNTDIGELLGQLYVAKHFPPEAKARMVKLVDQLIKAYQHSINNLDWMSADTRTKALEKLASFTPKIGYPDKWKDYSSLKITPKALIANIRQARTLNHQREVNKLGKPVDRSEWFMVPQKINAYYNPGMNEIVFPAAILQPPFFDLMADEAVNYGGIGGVIGHEIGHGFDDQGSKYTGDGNLINWWTDKDRQQFEQRTKSLVAQYGHYEPLPGLKINGELTLGENIGDLGGLSIALKAYNLSLQNSDAQKPSIIDGYTGQQRVLLGWAQAWRVKRRPELSERLLKTDPHSPPKYRVNGVVPNIDAFYSAFDLKEGDGMYLPPEERVKIW